MGSRGAEDSALQQTSMPTALLGVDLVATSLANATPEVDNLLRKECDIILECRFCRNLFRSIINFVSHKRTHCRGLYQTVAAAASAIGDIGRRSNSEKGAGSIEVGPRRTSLSGGEVTDSTSANAGFSTPVSNKNGNDKEASNEMDASKDDEISSSHTSIFTGTHLTRKAAKARSGPSNALRRISAVAVLNKRIETTTVELADGAARLDLHTLPRIAKSVPITKIANGVQEIVDLPSDLASKEPVESDRVVMVIPQDLTSSYGNMRLRNRRQAPGADVPARSVSPAEMELVERVTTHMSGQVDVATLSCLATSCEKDKRTFSSLKCLAYHISVWHKPLTPGNNRFICLLCGSLFARNVGLQTHLRMFHREIYDEHQRSRSLEREDVEGRGRRSNKKKARGSDESTANAAGDLPRSRSLSPLSNDDDPDDQDEDEKQESPQTRTRSLLLDGHDSSHIESPTRLSLSANRRSQNQKHADRLENVLASLRRGKLDAENDTDQRSASSASSSNKRVDLRRSHKKGASKLQANAKNATSTPLSETPTPTPKRGAGRPRKVVAAPPDEAAPSSVSQESDSAAINGTKLTGVPFPMTRSASGNMRTDTSDSKQATTKTPILRTQENNKDSSPSVAVKKERSVSANREATKEKDHEAKNATSTDADNDGGSVERITRSKRQSETRPVVESEHPTSSSSSDDDDKHTNTSGADSGTTGKSPALEEGTSEIAAAATVAALPPKRLSRARLATDQRKPIDADKSMDSDDSVEKSSPPAKTTASKRKAAPMPESSDSSEAEEEEEEMTSSVRAARCKRPPAYLADGSFITGFSGSKSSGNREEREEADASKAKESTKNAVKAPQTPTKKSESPAASKRKSPKSNSAGPKTKQARFETPTTTKNSAAGKSASASKTKSTPPTTPAELPSIVTSPPTSPSESRRKQNLAALPPTRSSDDIQIIKMPNQNPQRPRDLSDLPVYLTEGQRDLFTRSLQVLGSAKEDRHRCVHCDNVLPNIQEGRRHVVMHLNVIRLKCSLCGVGSFFCSDMRSHLMNRHCTNIDRVPTSILRPGKEMPCMSQEEADSLTQLVDISRPGRVLYTSGKVMSNEHPAGIQPPPSLDANLLPMVHVSSMYGGRSN